MRPRFVSPAPIRRLRDLTRHWSNLVGTRTADKNRVEKLLEDACIKLSVVASNIFRVSGRAMGALIAGERNPKVLAQLARASMRAKMSELEEAFAGYYDDYHGFLLSRMLTRTLAAPRQTKRQEACRRSSRTLHPWHCLAPPPKTPKPGSTTSDPTISVAAATPTPGKPVISTSSKPWATP